MTRLWILTSGRTGDDKQALRLASALDLPFEEKKIVFTGAARSWRLMLGPSLASIDPARSSALEPPWPDLVLSTGWRQVPVVRWIKQQSGGRTRLVQMNRPPSPEHFDLVLSPPQFRIPPRDNVIQLDWPLQPAPDPRALETARARWKARLDRFPHPWTVLLIGGTSHPFSIDPETARGLARRMLERAREHDGSVMISTSRRTPKETVAALTDIAAADRERIFLFGWSPEATDNPYVAWLADGDEFVMTPDSISMLVEVARLGRPLSIAPHDRTKSLVKDVRGAAKRLLHGNPERPRSVVGQRVSKLASLLGLKFERDLGSVSRRMISEGWAADFPDFGGRPGEALPDDDLPRLSARIRDLIGEDSGTGAR